MHCLSEHLLQRSSLNVHVEVRHFRCFNCSTGLEVIPGKTLMLVLPAKTSSHESYCYFTWFLLSRFQRFISFSRPLSSIRFACSEQYCMNYRGVICAMDWVLLTRLG